jgi:hypothetical protein
MIWDAPRLLFNWYWGFLRPRIKRVDIKIHNSPPVSGEVNNEWRNAFNPPIYLQYVDRDNFTFFS